MRFSAPLFLWMTLPMNNIAANLAALREKIARACADNGLDPRAVNLVAVSKQQPPDRIAQALAAGQRLFGENRVQEAKARWNSLRASYPDLKLRLIGPLQMNKVRDAVALFDCIETVDRPALVAALAKEMTKRAGNRPVSFRSIRGGARRAASRRTACPTCSPRAAPPVWIYAA